MDKQYCNKPIIFGASNVPCLLDKDHEGPCFWLREDKHPPLCPHCSKDLSAPVSQEELDAREFEMWAKETDKEANKYFPIAPYRELSHCFKAWNAALTYARKNAVKG